MSDSLGAISSNGIESLELPSSQLPIEISETGFRVLMNAAAHSSMLSHARDYPTVEVCGALMGNAYQDDKGPFLLITGAIRGEGASHRNAQVTFTQEAWAHIYKEQEAHYPNCAIAGWYHTHPGMGIFLSRMDLFIHENFFALPWQTAFVLDPHSGDDGLFAWNHGKVERMIRQQRGDWDCFTAPGPSYSPASSRPSGEKAIIRAAALEDHYENVILASPHLAAEQALFRLQCWAAGLGALLALLSWAQLAK